MCVKLHVGDLNPSPCPPHPPPNPHPTSTYTCRVTIVLRVCGSRTLCIKFSIKLYKGLPLYSLTYM